MAKKKQLPEPVSECMGAGRVVVGWLLENEQNELAARVAERIVSLNQAKGYELPAPNNVPLGQLTALDYFVSREED